MLTPYIRELTPYIKNVDSLHKAEMSNNEWDELMPIVQPARENGRLPPKEIEAILLKLCKNRWLTRKKIAELLNRNEEGLRSRFLSPMVTHGLLRLRHPEKPNRVDQAYIENDSK